jgi:hypothetical protein
MSKLLLIIPTLLLTGCLSTPVKMSWPDVPKELIEACPDLKQVEEKETKLSVVVDTVVQNYSMYHECRIKVDAWSDWYKSQKKIYESVK